MRVLVVDDHRPTIELMGMALTAFGHSVASATNVADALNLVAADCPDVVLSDLTFAATDEGDRDGYALARALRANPDHARVGLVAISGVTSPAALQAALDSGFNEVVQKPFDIEWLLERIETIGRQARSVS